MRPRQGPPALRRHLEVVDLARAFPAQPTSLHADDHAELYETDATGHIYHVEVAPSSKPARRQLVNNDASCSDCNAGVAYTMAHS